MNFHQNSSPSGLDPDQSSAQSAEQNIVLRRPGELIAGGDERQKSLLADIFRVLEAPDQGPQSLEVLQAVVASLELVTKHLHTPSTQCLQWLGRLHAADHDSLHSYDNLHAVSAQALNLG